MSSGIKTVLIVFIIILPPPLPTATWAHGVRSHIGQDARVWVAQAVFSDGTPMAYTQVTVIGPDAKLPFQKGFSDKNGRFAFVPDRPGKWKVIFQDPMGHRSEVSVSISFLKDDKQEAVPTSNSPPISSVSTGVKVLLGLCVILLLALLFRLSERKRS